MDLSNRPRTELAITICAAAMCVICSSTAAFMIYTPAGLAAVAAWSGLIAWLAATDA